MEVTWAIVVGGLCMSDGATRCVCRNSFAYPLSLISTLRMRERTRQGRGDRQSPKRALVRLRGSFSMGVLLLLTTSRLGPSSLFTPCLSVTYFFLELSWRSAGILSLRKPLSRLQPGNSVNLQRRFPRAPPCIPLVEDVRGGVSLVCDTLLFAFVSLTYSIRCLTDV